MANIVVPELGESVVEARVARWLKKEGDRVEVGEPLVELETEKIDLEVNADRAGVIASIACKEGEDVKIGEVLGTVDESAAAPKPGGNGASAAAAAKAETAKAADTAPAPKPAAAASPARQAGTSRCCRAAGGRQARHPDRQANGEGSRGRSRGCPGIGHGRSRDEAGREERHRTDRPVATQLNSRRRTRRSVPTGARSEAPPRARSGSG